MAGCAMRTKNLAGKSFHVARGAPCVAIKLNLLALALAPINFLLIV